MESCCADWHAPDDDVDYVPAEFVDQSVGVPDMDDFALLLEKKTGWTQDVGSVKSSFVKMWRQCRETFVAYKWSFPRTPFEVAKVGRGLLFSNTALEARLKTNKIL